MSVKRTLVEIAHDEGYSEDLLRHINSAFGGKDMRAERIVSNRQIIDAIDAEIAKTFAETGKMKLGSTRSAFEVLNRMAYVNGLRFAKELIEKRIEVTE